VTQYRQCRLRRGDWFTYTWLPVKLAVDGKAVTLKRDAGWVVDKAFKGITLDEKDISIVRDTHRKHRSVTDI